MVTGTLNASVFALWFLADYVLSETTTAISSTLTNSALVPTSTFMSPSLSQSDGALSENAKVGVSVSVTLGAILLVGSIAILCVIRRRNRVLTNPQRRVAGSRENVDDENMVGGDNPGKGKEIYYMSPPSNGHPGVFSQAPNGTTYQGGGGYPTTPDQTYVLQGQPQATSYSTAHYGEAYAYPGTAYPGTTAIDASQQNGYAGPSNTQYQPEIHLQPQQHQPQQYQQQPQQQQGDYINWTYLVSAASPVEAASVQDVQYQYLQDYQQQGPSPSPSHSQRQNGDSASTQGYQGKTYYVPPPHPHAIELPEQRKPVELMGEGHYKEAP
ncbi:hypothetical protein GGR58DRAFT_146322 [Xylaria digitata]|nr:hypothetical protein GGR58DRAFT_146322 [Xylaria digitata]